MTALLSVQAAAVTNNIAVCLLYVGRLKEGLQMLEGNITADPANMQVLYYRVSKNSALLGNHNFRYFV